MNRIRKQNRTLRTLLEPKEHEQNAKPKKQDTYGLEPQKINKHQKLPSTPTTMPRNTVAGKAAVGPVNTSNSKTVAVLTPQEELIVANMEIKQL